MPETPHPLNNLIDASQRFDARRKAFGSSEAPDRIAPISKIDTPEPARQHYNDNGTLHFEPSATARLFARLPQSHVVSLIERLIIKKPLDLMSLQGGAYRLKDTEPLPDHTGLWRTELDELPWHTKESSDLKLVDINVLIAELQSEWEASIWETIGPNEGIMPHSLERLERLVVRWQLPNHASVEDCVETPATVLISALAQQNKLRSTETIVGRKRLVLRFAQELQDLLLGFPHDAATKLNKTLAYLLENFQAGEDYVAYHVHRGESTNDGQKVTEIRSKIRQLPDSPR